jgi:hypothetical protein
MWRATSVASVGLGVAAAAGAGACGWAWSHASDDLSLSAQAQVAATAVVRLARGAVAAASIVKGGHHAALCGHPARGVWLAASRWSTGGDLSASKHASSER